jgi:glutaredoxin
MLLLNIGKGCDLVLKIYGKEGCSKCIEIKKKLEKENIEFEYIQDEKTMVTLARELMSKGQLVEQIAPIIIKDGKQIKHENLLERIG